MRLYGRLKGELRKAATDEEPLITPEVSRKYMRCIEGLMPLLNVDFDPEAIKAVRTRVQIGPLEWGELRTGTLVVLKDNGGWMNAREIAEALLARRRALLDQRDMKHFVQKVREALFFQMRAGAVERELDIEPTQGDRIQRYRLSRTLFRR